MPIMLHYLNDPCRWYDYHLDRNHKLSSIGGDHAKCTAMMGPKPLCFSPATAAALVFKWLQLPPVMFGRKFHHHDLFFSKAWRLQTSRNSGFVTRIVCTILNRFWFQLLLNKTWWFQRQLCACNKKGLGVHTLRIDRTWLLNGTWQFKRMNEALLLID